MKKIALAIFLGVASTVVLRADIFQIDFSGGGMNGGQEVPANGSPATAFEFDGGLTYDNSTMTLNVELAYGVFGGAVPLVGNYTIGQIYQGPAGVVGTPVIPLTNVPNDPHSGLIQNSVVLTPAQEVALFTDNLYVNIQSSLFPSGEIRAQLVPTSVPEPATWAMLGAGLAGLLILRRRAS